MGRSDDVNWRHHDDKTSPAAVGKEASRVSSTSVAQSSDVAALSVEAEEFVPQAFWGPTAGPYSFIAMSADGHPVTLYLQPSDPATPSNKSPSNVIVPPDNSKAAVLSTRNSTVVSSVENANRTYDGDTTKGNEEVNERESASDAKIISPRNVNTGYSRVTHRGIHSRDEAAIQSFTRQHVYKHSESDGSKPLYNQPSEAPNNPAGNQTRNFSKSVTEVDNSKSAPVISKSATLSSVKSGLNFTTNAPKKILQRGERVPQQKHQHPRQENQKQHQHPHQQKQQHQQRPFHNVASDFPALDRKLNELKLEAEAREEAPITWRRSVEPTNRKTEGVNANAKTSNNNNSYAARLKNDEGKNLNEDIGVAGEREAGDDDDDDGENVSGEKRKRRRRRRRRKPENDDAVETARGDDGGEGCNDRRDGAIDVAEQREVSVKNGAVMIRVNNDTSSLAPQAADGNEKLNDQIFKEDDFPDALVNLRRRDIATKTLPNLVMTTTRKIPRVIGSKVTKLGAGKPLSRTANEWTDVSDETETDLRPSVRPSVAPAAEADVGARAKPSSGEVWGNSATFSFADALKKEERERKCR